MTLKELYKYNARWTTDSTLVIRFKLSKAMPPDGAVISVLEEHYLQCKIALAEYGNRNVLWFNTDTITLDI